MPDAYPVTKSWITFLLKCFAHVDDFVRDVQALCDVFGDSNLATPTLLPPLRCRYGFILVLPYLERDSITSIPADQERGRDGAIHSTAHAKQHCRMCHEGFREKAGRAAMVRDLLVFRDEPRSHAPQDREGFQRQVSSSSTHLSAPISHMP